MALRQVSTRHGGPGIGGLRLKHRDAPSQRSYHHADQKGGSACFLVGSRALRWMQAISVFVAAPQAQGLRDAVDFTVAIAGCKNGEDACRLLAAMPQSAVQAGFGGGV